MRQHCPHRKRGLILFVEVANFVFEGGNVSAQTFNLLLEALHEAVAGVGLGVEEAKVVFVSAQLGAACLEQAHLALALAEGGSCAAASAFGTSVTAGLATCAEVKLRAHFLDAVAEGLVDGVLITEGHVAYEFPALLEVADEGAGVLFGHICVDFVKFLD